MKYIHLTSHVKGRIKSCFREREHRSVMGKISHLLLLFTRIVCAYEAFFRCHQHTRRVFFFHFSFIAANKSLSRFLLYSQMLNTTETCNKRKLRVRHLNNDNKLLLGENCIQKSCKPVSSAALISKKLCKLFYVQQTIFDLFASFFFHFQQKKINITTFTDC